VSDEVERLRAELAEASSLAASQMAIAVRLSAEIAGWKRQADAERAAAKEGAVLAYAAGKAADEATAALAALREAAVTYRALTTDRATPPHVREAVALGLANALAAPCSSLSTAYRAKVRREAMEEVAATMETIGWQQEYCFQSHDRVRFAHWLRALAAKGSE
jgi:hypothetical protein